MVRDAATVSSGLRDLGYEVSAAAADSNAAEIEIETSWAMGLSQLTGAA